MIITLYKYNSYFLRVPENVEDRPTAHSVELVRRLIPSGKAFANAVLKEIGITCSITGDFVALEDGDLLIMGLISEYAVQTMLTGLRINEDKLKHIALAKFHAWKEYHEHQLTEILLERPQSLRDPLTVCERYTHSDAHSFWIYNPYTQVFTCSATSHRYEKTFLTKEDNSTLFDFLKSSNEAETREPTHVFCMNTELAKCKTLNRIRMPLDDTGTIGVLNLYSLQSGFTIPDQVIRTITELVRSKYTESRIELHKDYEQIEQFFTTDYKLGELIPFLKNLTHQICTHLCFECCSIFTLDVNPMRLKLTSTTDAKISRGTVDNVFYKIDGTSLTGLVASTRKVQVSYDLTTDKRNSKNYSEATTLPGKNWIGVPIKIDSKVLGVVRVKNKYSSRTEKKELRNIRPADIEYMESIATMLASLMQIEELYVRSRKDLKEAQEKIIAQNDFNTVFLHEIKTPISTFSLAPYAIKRRMELVRNFILSGSKERSLPPTMETILRDSLDKIELRLADISVMADRLKFIVDTYFLDLIISRNQPQHLSVLQDVVFPVVNITKEFFRRNYELDIRIDASSLQGVKVFADQTMLTLVLNALVDNAGKYTIHSKRPVVISGSVDSDSNISIIVSNYGLAIESDEEEKIFEKGERGKMPKALNISGTGIGLHLGRRIMRQQKGDLKLLQRAEPVKFAMLLPGDL